MIAPPDDRLGGEPTAVLPPSLWAATAVAAPPTQALRGAHRAEVAIVGGGYTGLAAALALAERGRRAIVLDAAQPGWGASGRNNGQVIPGLKLDPDTVEAALGREVGGRLVAWAGDGPQRVFELIARHALACDAVQAGWIQPAYAPAALATIAARCRQWAARGADVAMVDHAELPALLGTTAFHGAWIDRRGGSLQPLSYARELARVAIAGGVRLYSASRARTLSREGGHWRIATEGGHVDADALIVATAGYSDGLVAGLARSVVQIRTAQVASAPLAPSARAVILPGRQVASDTRRLLTSFRLSPDGRLVMGGSGATGGGHNAALERRLHRAARALFGHLIEPRWEFGWSGYFALTRDHLPHIHEPAPGVHVAIGCNGRGIALSTGMGQLLAARALGASADELPIPITAMQRVAFHALRNAGIFAATRWKAVQDYVERLLAHRASDAERRN